VGCEGERDKRVDEGWLSEELVGNILC